MDGAEPWIILSSRRAMIYALIHLLFLAFFLPEFDKVPNGVDILFELKEINY